MTPASLGRRDYFLTKVQVVEQAHAVVLASGTLSPVASLTRQLFPGLPPSAITHFSCGHVVPKENLLAIALAQVTMLSLHPTYACC